jgi:hypothetical protein
MGDNHFAIVNAPDGRRISYVGFISSITSPLNLLPLAAAAIVGLIGISSIFVITAVFGVGTVMLALRMRPQGSREAHPAAGIPQHSPGPAIHR